MSSSPNNISGSLEAEKNTVLNRTFRDSEGRIVIAQMPNLPILVGLGAALLQFLLPSSPIRAGAELVSFGALFTWAWQEIFEGVNYFRRSLGLVAIVGLVAFKLHLGGL